MPPWKPFAMILCSAVIGGVCSVFSKVAPPSSCRELARRKTRRSSPFVPISQEKTPSWPSNGSMRCSLTKSSSGAPPHALPFSPPPKASKRLPKPIPRRSLKPPLEKKPTSTPLPQRNPPQKPRRLGQYRTNRLRGIGFRSPADGLAPRFASKARELRGDVGENRWVRAFYRVAS